MTSYYSGFYPSEFADGAKGSAAFLGAITTTIVYLYRRSATALTDTDKPNENTVYTFATANIDISAITNGWSKTIPAGTTTLYIVAATATGIDPTDTIAGAEWSSPVVFSSTGLNNATVFLFQRSNTSTLPARPTTTLTYTFATGLLSGTLGSWTQSAPDSSLGKYLFVTTATAINSNATDDIISTEWATVRVLAENGTMGYTAYLTNETHTLPAAFDGTVSDYTGATGQFRVFLDGVGDISSSFTLSTVAGSNVQALVIAYSANTYTISAGFDPAETIATITIRATGSGVYSGVVLDKVFSLSKSKAGANGSPAKLLSILIDRQLIACDSTGTLTPATQPVNFSASVQNSIANIDWTIKDTLGNTLTASSYLSNTTTAYNGSTTMTAAQFVSATSVNGAEGLVVTATLIDGAVYIDKVTIMKVKSGVNGTNGTNGTNGAPATSVYLTNEAQSLFAYANGNVVSFSTANGLFKVYSGVTDVTSSATGFSATASGCTGTVNTADGIPVAGKPIGYYRITAMSADTATLTLSVTYSGTTFTKIYTITKTRGGYEIVATLPATDLFEGRVVFLTTEDKLYRYTGTAWVSSVPATDITGTLENAQIASLAASKVTGQLSDTQLAAIAAAKVTGQITGVQIADLAITTGKFSSGIEPVTTVTSVPAVKSTNTIFNSADGKLYRWNGSSYVASVPSTDVTGTLTDAQLTAISAAKITGTLTDTQLAAISAAKITGTLTDTQLAAISATKITGTLTDTQLAAISASKVTGQITSTQITDGSISTAKIAAGAITAGKIAADSITANEIAANAITASELAAGSVIAGKIAADSITANEIAANAITASELAAGSVIAGKIAADSITANEIAANAITASELAAGSVIAGKIAADSITANEIAANAITTNELAANSVIASKIVAGTITATEIASDTITAGQIAAGAITASEISANAITASKIVLTNTMDVFPDTGFNDFVWHNLVGLSNVTRYAGGIALSEPAGSLLLSSGSFDRMTLTVPVEEGSVFTIRFRIFISSTATGWVGPSIHIPGQTWANPAPRTLRADVDSSQYPVIDLASTVIPRNTWVTYTNQETFLAGITPNKYIQFRHRSGLTAGNVYYAWEVVRASDASLIVDGAITADKVAANAITAAKIAAGTITSNEIAANTITAADIAAETITAAQIAAATITAAKIAASTITSSQIAADTITSNNIAANAITASELATDSVTANKINAGAVTSGKISVTSLSAITATIGTLRTATTGARTEIKDNLIEVYDGSNVLRVRMGIW